MKLTPVILCGGIGSRLWPSSRLAYPKPCLTLNENEPSFLQHTLIRIAHLALAPPIIVCNQRHRFVIAEQVEALKSEYPYLNGARIILEPCPRNTAPAITLAALESLTSNEDNTLLVLPSDHVIQKDERFDQSILQAVTLAQKGNLVTFGIQPTRAETGFGYIRTADNINVLAFIEKPSQEKADIYLSQGGYLWNSGMFVFNAKHYLSELKSFKPEIFNACQSAFKARQMETDFIRICAPLFEACPADSIDYAVMEKTTKAKVVPFYCKWQDIGNWQAFYDQAEKDDNQNKLIGDVISQDSKGCLIKSESRLVATLGIDNLVIIETSDAVLVMNKDKSQQMGELIKHLKDAGRSEYLTQNTDKTAVH